MLLNLLQRKSTMGSIYGSLFSKSMGKSANELTKNKEKRMDRLSKKILYCTTNLSDRSPLRNIRLPPWENGRPPTTLSFKIGKSRRR